MNTLIYANSQKTKPPYFELKDFSFFQQAEVFNIDVIGTFFKLTGENLLPSWVMQSAPMVKFKEKKVDKYNILNAYISPDLVLFGLNNSGEYNAAFTNDIKINKVVHLWDVQTNEQIKIFIYIDELFIMEGKCFLLSPIG